MSVLLQLALRNVFRNKRRTGITFFSIVSGMVGMIVFGGFVSYTFWGLRESTIHTQVGHIQIYKKGYSEQGVAQPSLFLLEHTDTLFRSLRAIKSIQVATSRLSAAALLSTGEKTVSCKIIGVDPKEDASFSSFETVVYGSQLGPNSPEDGGVIGIELMHALGKKVGDYLTVLSTTKEGMLNAIEFKIIGVSQTGSQEYDSVFVKLPLKKVQSLLGTQGVEKIVLLLNKTSDMEHVLVQLTPLLEQKENPIEYKTWQELSPFYGKVVNIYKGIFKLVTTIIGTIILLGVTNTMSMSIFERVREIGTLRAMGTSRQAILSLFILEGFLLGSIGGILGVLVSVIVAKLINISGGIAVSAPPGMSKGYTAFIWTPFSLLSFSFLFIVLVTTLSSLYPAYRASRLRIVEALAYH